MAMSEEALRQKVLEVLVQTAPDIDVTQVHPAKNFRDQFEIDSVDFLTLVLALEKRLDVRIPELDYPKLSNLNGCVAYLSKPAQS